MRRTNAGYHHARRTATARQLNPIRYQEDYFGHKVRIDQNEKMVMYGYTHVCAVDRFRGKIVGFITTPVKNNIEIYSHLFQLVCRMLFRVYIYIRAATIYIFVMSRFRCVHITI